VKVGECRHSLIQHLVLSLWIKILLNLIDDTKNFFLPLWHIGCALVDEVKNILFIIYLVKIFISLFFFLLYDGGCGDNDVQIFLLFICLVCIFFHQIFFGLFMLTLLLIYGMSGQSVSGIDEQFDFIFTIFFLAALDVVFGEDHVIDDGTGSRPLLEHIIILEDEVVPNAGMGYNQSLSNSWIFFHQVRDAGIRIDYDLIGQTHLTLLIFVPVF